MNFKLKTAPTVEPITLDEVRQTLGITNLGDISRDSIITSRIVSARRWAEHHTRRAFINQTWYGYADAFEDRFDLKADLQSVTAITYVDTDGASQTLAADQYLVDTVTSRLYPAYGVTWPSTRDQVNAVRVEFVSGYGAAATAVPQDIKDALMFIVGQWENYQSSIEGAVRPSTVPYAVLQLLQPYVDMRNNF
jgi:uncharacterized phiE125 gp8 family phage protein